MLVNVPRLAFTEVTIYDNTTTHEDELIAQRLAMVPIDSNDTMDPFECHVDVTGKPVLFSDLTPLAIPHDAELIHVKPNEHFKCVVKADVGTGKDHAKWMSCTRIKYNPKTHVLEFWTNGSLKPEEILNRAKTELLKKMDNIIYDTKQ